MNQIPNIEETHNTREWEDEFANLTKGEIGTDFEGNEYTLWDVCYDHDKDKRTVAEVIADFIHQQLQKAREEERERIKKDLDRRLEIQKKVSSSEYEGGYTHALQDVKEAYQSELDQPTV